MSAIDSLMELADRIGFDAVDEEIAVWIEAGAFDEAVKERMRWIQERSEENDGTVYLDKFHRYLHPNGPIGREFCGHCK